MISSTKVQNSVELAGTGQVIEAHREDIEIEQGFQRTAIEAKHIRSLISELVINPALNGILDGLEGFPHALVLVLAAPLASSWAVFYQSSSHRGKEVSPGRGLCHVQSGQT